MDKLELDLNDLEVDSFKTNPEQEDERGTVQGHEPTVGTGGCNCSLVQTCGPGCDPIETLDCPSLDCPSFDGPCTFVCP